jgi:heptosyltransferase-2
MRVLIGIIHNILFNKLSCHKKIDYKRILLFRSSTLGDFIFSIPSMVALRKKYPLSKIVLLTVSTAKREVRKQVQAYIGSEKDLPWVSFVVPTIVDEVYILNKINPYALKESIIPIIKEFQPDLAVILPQQFGGGFLGIIKKLMFLRYIGVRCSVFGWRIRNTLLFKYAQYKAGLLDHAVKASLRAICEIPPQLRIEGIEIVFPLHIGHDAKIWVEELWKYNKLHNKVVVAVAPGSIQPHKQWPSEKFKELLQKLTFEYNISVVVVGTKNDIILGEGIVSSISHVGINIAGKTSIMQVAALFGRCALLVGNDGGAVHLASAMGCPSVSIIPGLEYPGSVEPWQFRDLAVRHSVPCAPCYNMTNCPKGHNRCMKELPLEDVYKKCTDVLNKVIKSHIL